MMWLHSVKFQGQFVILYRLGLATFNPHTKFEMSTITCNEDYERQRQM